MDLDPIINDDEEDLDLDNEEEDVDDKEEDEDAAPTFNSLPAQPMDGPPLPPNPVQPSYPVPIPQIRDPPHRVPDVPAMATQSSGKSSL
jgi:hypothetical protein